MSAPDPNKFRNALGQFATGVTVITSADADGKPVGVTASSFNSVSLDPPLVLWSLAKNSGSLQAYQDSGHFCVHVLASTHESLSQRFASRGTDKFADIEWQEGAGGAPLLPDYAARFQCKTTYQYEGGDHVIFVGEVLDFDTRDEQPLVFHQGRYATAKPHQAGEAAGDAVDLLHGNFSDNFFLYLLSRAHYLSSIDLNRELAKANLTQPEYLTLTVLGLAGALSWQEISEHLDHTGIAPESAHIKKLLDAALIVETHDGAKFSITVKGRNMYLRFLAVSKSAEKRILANFTDSEVADVREFLQRFIDAADPGLPSLWQAAEKK